MGNFDLSLAQRVAVAVALPIASFLLYFLLKRSNDEEEVGQQIYTSRQTLIEVKVPAAITGSIIGIRGSKIKEVQDGTGARIQFKDDNNDEGNERTLVIRGSLEAAQQAERIICRMIAEVPPTCKLTMNVPVKAVGRIIGRSGETIRTLCRTSKCRIQVPRTMGMPGFQQIHLEGSSVAIAAAQALITEKVNEESALQAHIAVNASNRVERGPRRKESSMNNVDTSNKVNASGDGDSGNKELTKLELPAENESLKLIPEPAEWNRQRKYLDVYVSAVQNPGHFWVQVISAKSMRLDELSQEMTSYYSRLPEDELTLLDKVQVGDILAAPFDCDDMWYRVRLTDVKGEEVDAYYVDFGDSCFLKKSQLRPLRPDFLSLPLQAVEVCLANVKPKGDTWSDEAISLFEELTHNAKWKVMNACTISYDNTDDGQAIPCLELIDTNGASDVNVAKVLIEKDVAEFHQETTIENDTSSTTQINTSRVITSTVLVVPGGLTGLPFERDSALKVSTVFEDGNDCDPPSAILYRKEIIQSKCFQDASYLEDVGVAPDVFFDANESLTPLFGVNSNPLIDLQNNYDATTVEVDQLSGYKHCNTHDCFSGVSANINISKPNSECSISSNENESSLLKTTSNPKALRPCTLVLNDNPYKLSTAESQSLSKQSQLSADFDHTLIGVPQPDTSLGKGNLGGAMVNSLVELEDPVFSAEFNDSVQGSSNENNKSTTDIAEDCCRLELPGIMKVPMISVEQQNVHLGSCNKVEPCYLSAEMLDTDDYEKKEAGNLCSVDNNILLTKVGENGSLQVEEMYSKINVHEVIQPSNEALGDQQCDKCAISDIELVEPEMDTKKTVANNTIQQSVNNDSNGPDDIQQEPIDICFVTPDELPQTKSNVSANVHLQTSTNPKDYEDASYFESTIELDNPIQGRDKQESFTKADSKALDYECGPAIEGEYLMGKKHEIKRDTELQHKDSDQSNSADNSDVSEDSASEITVLSTSFISTNDLITHIDRTNEEQMSLTNNAGSMTDVSMNTEETCSEFALGLEGDKGRSEVLIHSSNKVGCFPSQLATPCVNQMHITPNTIEFQCLVCSDMQASGHLSDNNENMNCNNLSDPGMDSICSPIPNEDIIPQKDFCNTEIEKLDKSKRNHDGQKDNVTNISLLQKDIIKTKELNFEPGSSSVSCLQLTSLDPQSNPICELEVQTDIQIDSCSNDALVNIPKSENATTNTFMNNLTSKEHFGIHDSDTNSSLWSEGSTSSSCRELIIACKGKECLEIDVPYSPETSTEEDQMWEAFTLNKTDDKPAFPSEYKSYDDSRNEDSNFDNGNRNAELVSSCCDEKFHEVLKVSDGSLSEAYIRQKPSHADAAIRRQNAVRLVGHLAPKHSKSYRRCRSTGYIEGHKWCNSSPSSSTWSEHEFLPSEYSSSSMEDSLEEPECYLLSARQRSPSRGYSSEAGCQRKKYSTGETRHCSLYDEFQDMLEEVYGHGSITSVESNTSTPYVSAVEDLASEDDIQMNDSLENLTFELKDRGFHDIHYSSPTPSDISVDSLNDIQSVDQGYVHEDEFCDATSFFMDDCIEDGGNVELLFRPHGEPNMFDANITPTVEFSQPFPVTTPPKGCNEDVMSSLFSCPPENAQRLMSNQTPTKRKDAKQTS